MDKKISQLTVATAVASGNLFVIVQGGVTKQLDFSVLTTDFLLKSGNLSGLSNPATARVNLGNVLTDVEVDTAIANKLLTYLSNYTLQDSDSTTGKATFSTLSTPLRVSRQFNMIFWDGDILLIRPLTSGNILFTIPLNYRPLRQQFVQVMVGTTVRNIIVQINGDVVWFDATLGGTGRSIANNCGIQYQKA